MLHIFEPDSVEVLITIGCGAYAGSMLCITLFWRLGGSQNKTAACLSSCLHAYYSIRSA